MDNATIWWIAAGALVAVELMTGTFYLLMLAIGVVAAAITAHTGASLTNQMVVGALVGGLAAVLWRSYRLKNPAHAKASEATQQMDVGETVLVQAWDEQGLTRVQYRGADWTALPAPGQDMALGPYRIQAINGNRLVLEKI